MVKLMQDSIITVKGGKVTRFAVEIHMPKNPSHLLFTAAYPDGSTKIVEAVDVTQARRVAGTKNIITGAGIALDFEEHMPKQLIEDYIDAINEYPEYVH